MTNRPNVLLLMVDALRADRCVGDDRSCRTPFIDRLCDSSTLFADAFSTASTTTICAASMLTGTYPFVHGVRSLVRSRLGGQLQTMAEAFAGAGYQTWAEVTGPLLPVTGMNRGFGEYRCRPSTEWLDTGFGESLRARLNQAARPWFGLVHLWEVHNPRRIRPPFDDPGYGLTRYDRAVSSLDHQLGLLLDGPLDDTIVIFTADHGEHVSRGGADVVGRLRRPLRWLRSRVPGARRLRRSSPVLFRVADRFGGTADRSLYLDWLAHGYHVYDYLVRVPLFVRGGPFPSGRRVDGLVSHVDLLPTLAAALDLPLRGGERLSGRDLMPSIVGGRTSPPRSLYLEATGGARAESRPESRINALRTDDYKYAARLQHPEAPPELFDLRADPAERRNVARELPEVAAAMHGELVRLMTDGSGAPSEAGYSAEELHEVESRLRDLGYLD